LTSFFRYRKFFDIHNGERAYIYRMKLYSLALDVVPCTAKIIKNRRNIFERGEYLLRNGVLNFVFRISQLSEIELQN